MEWPVIHAYQRLVEEGKVKALRCPDCDTVYISRIGSDDQPVLWCMVCDSKITPGLSLTGQITAVVREHDVS
jgi:hypothetical protein